LDIEVEVFGQLLPGDPRKRVLTLTDSVTVQDVARIMGLEPQDVGLISINGVQSEMDAPVPPDARLCFFPFLSGG
jgi:hypothetical protein